MLKTKTERVLLLAVAFLAGCEASRLANVEEPPIEHTARADETAPGKRWQYTCMRPDQFGGIGPEGIAAEANKFGAQGWELVGAGYVNNSTWCFKRPYGAAASAPVSAQ
jgi:hypothetical protein